MALVTILDPSVCETEPDAVPDAGHGRIVREDGRAVVLDNAARLVDTAVADERPAIWQGLSWCRARVELDGPRASTAVAAVARAWNATLRLCDGVRRSWEEAGAAVALISVLDASEGVSAGGTVGDAGCGGVVGELGDDVVVDDTRAVVLRT